MKQSSAKLLLAAVFIARGSSFMFSKHLMGTMSPMNILAVRFILAFLVLAVVFWSKLKGFSRASLRGGLILGILYTVCMIFEMYGLRLVDSGVSALIENMAILFVPLYVALWTRTWPRAKTLFCAVLAIAGVGLLSISQMSMNNGGLGLFLISCPHLRLLCYRDREGSQGGRTCCHRDNTAGSDGCSQPDCGPVHRWLCLAPDPEPVVYAPFPGAFLQLLRIHIPACGTEVSVGRDCGRAHCDQSTDCQHNGGCGRPRGAHSLKGSRLCGYPFGTFFI